VIEENHLELFFWLTRNLPGGTEVIHLEMFSGQDMNLGTPGHKVDASLSHTHTYKQLRHSIYVKDKGILVPAFN
jgi:hypothetical protein